MTLASSVISAVALLLAATVAGVALRLNALMPSGLMTIGVYSPTLAIHGLLGIGFLYALLLSTLASDRQRLLLGHRWMLLSRATLSVIWLHVSVGVAVSAFAYDSKPDANWTLVLMLLAGVLSAVCCLWAGIVSAREHWLTAIVALVAGVLLLRGFPAPETVFLLILARTIDREGRRGRPMALGITVALSALCALRLFSEVLFHWLEAIRLLLAIALLLLVWKWSGKQEGVLPERCALICAVVVNLAGAMLRAHLSLVGGVAPHIADTLLVVAAAHAEFFAPALAAFGWFRSSAMVSEPTPAQKRFNATTALAMLGGTLFCFGMSLLASRGMPRRYFKYLPELTVWQRWTTVGAVLAAAAIALGSWSLVRGFRRRRAPLA